MRIRFSPRVAALALLAGLASLTAAAPAGATDQIQLLPGLDNAVTAISPPDANGVRYLGGSFQRFNSYDSGRAAVFDATTGAINPAFPKVNGLIKASLPDGMGGFYLGGSFVCIGALNSDNDCADAGEFARTGLARINADGSVSDWDPAPSGGMGTVNALVLSGTTLYVGGQFSAIGGATRASLAALSTTTDTNNATAWDPGVSGGFMGEVNALVLAGTTLYVGGNFTTLGGASRSNIGAVTTGSNTATSWNPGASNSVSALALSGSTLYAGGNFTTLGGAARNRIGALSTGSNSATSWNPGASALVRTLIVSGTTIYAGGDFQTIGSASRKFIAALDTTADTNNATAWNPDANGQVFGMLLDGTTLYIGGYFSNVEGLSRYGIAALDTTVNANIVTSWAPTTTGAFTISKAGSLIFAGGNFQEAGGLVRDHLAAITSAGNLTDWNPGANNVITAIRTVGSTVYVAGDFTTIGGAARNGLAAVSADGTVLPWNPAIVGGGTHTLEIAGDKLLIGGYFTAVGGVARTNLAMISLAGSCATTFADACVTSWNPPATNTVNPGDGADVDVIAVAGTTALIGGRFTEIDGDSRTKLAALSISDTCTTAYTKAACLLSWNPQANGAVKSLAQSGDTVYVGGEFTTIAGATRNRLAALDAGSACRSSWSNGSCLGGWNPGASSSVKALSIGGSTLYAGGTFTTLGGSARGHAGAISVGGSCATTFTASPCLLSWNPDTAAPNYTGQVEAIDAGGSSVLIGGYFATLGGTYRRGFARLDADGTIGASIPAPSVPGAPTGVSATATGTSAVVSFTAPGSTGGSLIIAYTATCASTTGGTTRTQTGAASPLTVAALTAGATYSCAVVATSAAGDGPASSASSAFTIGGGSGTSSDVPAATTVTKQPTASSAAASDASRSPLLRIRPAVVGARATILRLRVAGAGTLRVVGRTAALPSGVRAATVVVCTASRTVAGPGAPWVACAHSAALLRARSISSVRVTYEVRFTPTKGAPVRESRAVVLPRLQQPATPLLG